MDVVHTRLTTAKLLQLVLQLGSNCIVNVALLMFFVFLKILLHVPGTLDVFMLQARAELSAVAYYMWLITVAGAA